MGGFDIGFDSIAAFNIKTISSWQVKFDDFVSLTFPDDCKQTVFVQENVCMIIGVRSEKNKFDNVISNVFVVKYYVENDVIMSVMWSYWKFVIRFQWRPESSLFLGGFMQDCHHQFHKTASYGMPYIIDLFSCHWINMGGFITAD